MAEIQFTGGVGADAELRFTANGAPVLNFRACDSKSRKRDDGTWETLAETWYAVSLFGPAAEAQQHEVKKGTRVKVAGEFYTREYEGKNGPGISNDVRAVGVQVLPSRKNDGQGQGGGWDNQKPPAPSGDAWTGGNTTGWGGSSANEPPF
ncbi:single-stranded DNA-binding protein [Micrococcus luteus]|nr:single-stranded DNA-binding protein [Micrococcus luteus]MCV7574088.1 single-stranded DNA-binding protein [Micrococcus luteus]